MTIPTQTTWLASAGAVAVAEPFSADTEVARAGYSADTIIVRARPGASTSALRQSLAARGLSLGRRIPHTRLFAVHTNGRSSALAVRSLAYADAVATATLNYVRHAFDVPNDPYFASGQPYLAAIRMPQAWDLSHGSRGVTIAVLDTGVTPVEDLAGQLLPGHNFVQDDDASFDEEPAPDSGDPRDTSVIGHGTLVAGIAAASTNNGVGIAGVAWDASVLPVKVLNARGAGTDFQIAAGIVWAVDHGAGILNLSLGGSSESAGLCEAVAYATAKGTLVVAAAGNGHKSVPAYPAACPGVVAVSATDTSGDFASFSNYGLWVDLAAPGIQITSTRNDGQYGSESGTSLAAPIIAGVAALLKAQHPDWDPAQIATRLEQTAQDRGPAGRDSYYGHGLLDAHAALGGPTQTPVTPEHDALEPNDIAHDATPLTASATGTIAPEGDVDWYAVRVRTTGTVVFQVEGPPHDPSAARDFTPVLQIFDHHLHRLAKRTRRRVGAGERAVARVPAAGRYYLRVANNCGARSPGSYTVTVKMSGRGRPTRTRHDRPA
jgi:subtilisin family serine protease